MNFRVPKTQLLRSCIVCFACLFLFLSAISAPAQEATEVDQEILLNEVQKYAFSFFWREVNPANGLVKDRAGNFAQDDYIVASIASSGFALAAMPIGVERGWISKKDAKKRTLDTLKFFLLKAEQKEGFFYHFLGMRSGRRTWRCELSSIDTALLLSGAIVAREYFKDSTISHYVDEIYKRVNFAWMLNNGPTLSMGWKPESGFLEYRWDQYNEGIMLTLLAIASETYPISPKVWDNIKRRVGVYGPDVVVQSPPLFTHQYPHLFFDFRNKHDAYMDYFENSRRATDANRRYSMAMSNRYQTFSEGYWGLTASDGPTGYKAYGAEPGGALTDGTVAPTGAITSIMFTPFDSLEFLKRLYTNEKKWLWGRYGFTDAFNMKPKWKSPDVIGIDQGAILLGIENYRTGLIWKLFSNSKEAKRAFELVKFVPGKMDFQAPEPPVYRVIYSKDKVDWAKIPEIHLTDARFLELGNAEGIEDLDVKLQFVWDDRYLYFRAVVSDDAIISLKKAEYIWQNDCLEFFVDPKGEGLRWGDPRSFQIGLSPAADLSGIQTWSWFQKMDPSKSRSLDAIVKPSRGGYEMKGKIRWDFLKVAPKSGQILRFTPAFHDMDKKKIQKKYTWHFLSKDARFDLGKLILE